MLKLSYCKAFHMLELTVKVFRLKSVSKAMHNILHLLRVRLYHGNTEKKIKSFHVNTSIHW